MIRIPKAEEKALREERAYLNDMADAGMWNSDLQKRYNKMIRRLYFGKK